ncbi:hypothetical protein BE11_20570 [Sorangium cellulosum]|nr:hypothetical protein BE11_20570 [Sorangium cellulosum]
MPSWLKALLCCCTPRKRATASGGAPTTITRSSQGGAQRLATLWDEGTEETSEPEDDPGDRRGVDPGRSLVRAYASSDPRPAIFECAAQGDRPTSVRVTMLSFVHGDDDAGSLAERLDQLLGAGGQLDQAGAFGDTDGAGTLPLFLAPEGFLSGPDGVAISDEEREAAFARIAAYSKEHPGMVIIPGSCFFETDTHTFNVVPVFHDGELQCVYCKRWPGSTELSSGKPWGTRYPDSSKDTSALFLLRDLTFAVEVCNDYRRNHVLRFFDEQVGGDGVDIHLLPSLGVIPEADTLSTYADGREGATRKQRLIKFTHSRARKNGYFLHCDAGNSNMDRESMIKNYKCTIHQRGARDKKHKKYNKIHGHIPDGSSLVSFAPRPLPPAD